MDELVPIDKRTKQFAIRIVKLYNSSLFHFSLLLFPFLSFSTPRIALASRLPSVGGYSCRFAKALGMDFMPGLAEKDKKDNI